MAPRAQATQATERLARMPSGGVGVRAPSGAALGVRSRAKLHGRSCTGPARACCVA